MSAGVVNCDSIQVTTLAIGTVRLQMKSLLSLYYAKSELYPGTWLIHKDLCCFPDTVRSAVDAANHMLAELDWRDDTALCEPCLASCRRTW